MRRVWGAVAVVGAAAAGFLLGFVLASLIGLSTITDAECDGFCFDKVDDVALVAIAVGGVCGIVAGYFAWRLFQARFTEPS